MKAKSKYLLILAALVAIGISACSKGDNPTPDDDKKDTTDYGIFYKVYRVENFLGDTTDNDPTSSRATLYYSLETNSPREVKYQKTSTWDLAFAGTLNSFISANNGTGSKNFGSGSPATGGILILKAKFEDVTDIPSDDQFNTSGQGIGTDASGDFGEGTGWYLYDFDGDIMGDGTEQKRHVAYALTNTRTIVVRTAKGNYAKVKMISCYKDAFTMDKWFKDTPHMYFTFEYVLAPKGSSKFEIKP